MIRKIISVIGVMLSIAMLAACGDTQLENKEDENLTVPQYETQEMSVAVLNEGESVIINGYIVEEFDNDGYYVSRPEVKNRIKGVEYLGDNNWVLDESTIRIYQSANRPEGTTDTMCDGLMHGDIMFAYQPDFGYNKDSAERAKEMSPIEFEFYRADLVGLDDDDKKKKFRTCDVRAVSFALYEEFYPDRPELTLKVYGVPRSLWESKVGTDMVFKYAEYYSFYEECKKNGYSQCTLLAEKDIEATGVYYIDYNALDKQGDFIEYVIVGNFSKSGIYSYKLNTFNAYNINPKEIDIYNNWKQSNIGKFIAGK